MGYLGNTNMIKTIKIKKTRGDAFWFDFRAVKNKTFCILEPTESTETINHIFYNLYLFNLPGVTKRAIKKKMARSYVFFFLSVIFARNVVIFVILLTSARKRNCFARLENDFVCGYWYILFSASQRVQYKSVRRRRFFHEFASIEIHIGRSVALSRGSSVCYNGIWVFIAKTDE